MRGGRGEVEVKRVFIGAGCNRIVNNVSWGASGFVSFGAQNAVAIFCPKVLFSPSSACILNHYPRFYFPFVLFILLVFAECSNCDYSSGSQVSCELHPLAPNFQVSI